LKKFASHFFNPAFGVTGEKEAAYAGTGEKIQFAFNNSDAMLLNYKRRINLLLLRMLERRYNSAVQGIAG